MKTNWLRMATFAMVCVACLGCVGTPALAQQFPVTERILKNGMKVLVQSDHSIPNVALYIFYRIGSRNERPGTTGISHFFEHMMFNGAKKYGPGELDKVMEANGGSNNAYTSQNVTVYQDWFPRSATGNSCATAGVPAELKDATHTIVSVGNRNQFFFMNHPYATLFHQTYKAHRMLLNISTLRQ